MHELTRGSTLGAVLRMNRIRPQRPLTVQPKTRLRSIRGRRRERRGRERRRKSRTRDWLVLFVVSGGIDRARLTGITVGPEENRIHFATLDGRGVPETLAPETLRFLG